MQPVTPHSLFPNTGHHHFFLPLDGGDEAATKALEAVIKRCKSDKDEWQPYVTAVSADAKGAVTRLSWLLWRLGTHAEHDSEGRPIFRPGIWVCVETNIGGVERGSILRSREAVGEPRPFNAIEFPSPYYTSDLGDSSLAAADAADKQIVHSYPFTLAMVREKAGITNAKDSPLPIPGRPEQRIGLGNVLGIGGGASPGPVSARAAQEEVQRFAMWWPKYQSAEEFAWEVDLVVDFGNSRSVALLLERPPQNVGTDIPELINLLSPVRMMPRGSDYEPNRRPDGALIHDGEDPLAVFDSWFVTAEPQFAALHPPHRDERDAMRCPFVERIPEKKKLFGGTPAARSAVIAEERRVPHMFVEMAPCVLGKEAAALLSEHNPSEGGTIFLSSPKRYVWDTEPLAAMEWGMVPRSRSGSGQTPSLKAHVLAFMPQPERPDRVDAERQADWPISDPPPGWSAAERPDPSPSHPHHSKSDSMIWAALAVIEQAYRQMSSSVFLEKNQQFVKRKLKSVVVTYPPGWSGDELRIYKRKWNTALNIFALTHLAFPEEDVPELRMIYDEAISAQLPIVYGEIERMGRHGRAWLDLVGRRDENDVPKARIMTVDIGGGTTDYAIFEYEDKLQGQGVKLECSLLFKDSSSCAGDGLVQALIQEMLLPAIGRNQGRAANNGKKTFEDFFTARGRTNDDLQEWRKFVRLGFVPKINQWLSDYSHSNGVGAPAADKLDGRSFDTKILTKLNDLWRKRGGADPFLDPTHPIHYSYEEIDVRIRRLFRPLFEVLSKLVVAFDVDLVILSGKPSELPGVRNLLAEVLPLLPSKIISVKDYQIGDWYPYQEGGRIYDAKTVTASGVALSRAMDIGTKLVPGWARIRRLTSDCLQRHNCWVQVPATGVGASLRNILIYLDNGTYDEFEWESKECDILVGTRIGRTILPALSNVEPVYQLRWRSSALEQQFGAEMIQVRFRRILPEVSKDPEVPTEPEYLELISVNHEHGKVTMDMVELRLCPLTETSFWMDKAEFEVKWTAPDNT